MKLTKNYFHLLARVYCCVNFLQIAAHCAQQRNLLKPHRLSLVIEKKKLSFMTEKERTVFKAKVKTFMTNNSCKTFLSKKLATKQGKKLTNKKNRF